MEQQQPVEGMAALLGRPVQAGACAVPRSRQPPASPARGGRSPVGSSLEQSSSGCGRLVLYKPPSHSVALVAAAATRATNATNDASAMRAIVLDPPTVCAPKLVCVVAVAVAVAGCFY